jgi:GT2 family glycosyltransferase
MSEIEISIIIVSYNCADFISTCLNSIYNNETDLNFEVIVVDNNSSDNIEVFLKEAFPFVKLLQMGYNSGFARANNAGIKIATGRKILFLNPDIKLIHHGTITKASNFIEKFSDKLNILGVQLMWEDGVFHGNLNLKPYSLRKVLSKNAIVKKLYNFSVPSNSNLSYFNGAFIMLWRETLVRNKLYWDEDFFLYGEDVEWCFRAMKKKLCFVKLPELTAIHLAGSCSRNQIARKSQILVSDWLAARKTRGVLYSFVMINMEMLNVITDEMLFVFAKIKKKQFSQDVLSEMEFVKIKKKLIVNYGLRIILSINLSTKTKFYTNCYEAPILREK